MALTPPPRAEHLWCWNQHHRCSPKVTAATNINPLTHECIHMYRTVNYLHLSFKNQFIIVQDKSCCLFWYPYKAHTCYVSTTKNFWMLNMVSQLMLGFEKLRNITPHGHFKSGVLHYCNCEGNHDPSETKGLFQIWMQKFWNAHFMHALHTMLITEDRKVMCDNVAYLKNATSYVPSKAILQTLPQQVE